VAVIDGRLNRGVPELADAAITVREPSYCLDKNGNPMPATTTYHSADHGTTMAALVAGNGGGGGIIGAAPDATVRYYNTFITFGDRSNEQGDFSRFNGCGNGDDGAAGYRADDEAFVAGVKDAVADGADIITTSVDTPVSGEEIYGIVADALRKGVILIAAHPNTNINDGGLGASNGVLSVVGFDAAGELNVDSDTGQPISDESIGIAAPGVDILGYNPGDEDNWGNYFLSTGNSNAAPLVAGMLAALWSKYPEATSNQILQSALTNTTDAEHDMLRDPKGYWGYGPISLRHLLAVDPTQYPDINPLLSHDRLAKPSYEEVMGIPEPTETAKAPGYRPSRRADRTEAPAPVEPGGFPVLPVVVGVGVAAVLGALVVSLAVRRSRRAGSGTAPRQPLTGPGVPASASPHDDHVPGHDGRAPEPDQLGWQATGLPDSHEE
jgi:hypothetical protein